MKSKIKINVACKKCGATYEMIVPKGYDLQKDPYCKRCEGEKGKIKEVK